ncbi:MAG: hypothetical protein Kow0042_23430 [Calditrichia bacterium]
MGFTKKFHYSGDHKCDKKLCEVHELKRIIWILLFLWGFAFWGADLRAQSPAQYLYLDDVVYDYFDYQINSGKPFTAFVLRQPYDLSHLQQFKSENRPAVYFQKFWNNIYQEGGVKGHLQFSEKMKYQEGDFRNRYGAMGGIHYLGEHISLANRVGFHQEYKYDPLYAGDLSEADDWIYGRVNDAYIRLNMKRFSFFMGRMQRNWGPLHHKSFMLSDNPYTYDHFLFSYTTRKLKLSVIFAQLENLKAYGQNDKNNPDSLTYYPDARKFLVGHRLDIRFSANFQVALSEMATYGGPDRDVEWSFLNPMIFYYGLQRNNRKLMDGNWTLDVFWKPARKLTLYIQFLIDDIIVNNDPGIDDRARYPDRWAIMGSLRTGDLLLNGLNTEFSYVRVWNRTYQSRWTYENYHYRELGLGYPCAGCEELKLRIGLWKFFPLYIKNELIIGRYGNVHLTDVFPLEKEEFPVEPVIENVVNKFTAMYFAHPRWQIYFILENYRDARHYANRLNEGSVYTATFGLRFVLSKGLQLEE